MYVKWILFTLIDSNTLRSLGLVGSLDLGGLLIDEVGHRLPAGPKLRLALGDVVACGDIAGRRVIQHALQGVDAHQYSTLSSSAMRATISGASSLIRLTLIELGKSSR